MFEKTENEALVGPLKKYLFVATSQLIMFTQLKYLIVANLKYTCILQTMHLETDARRSRLPE